MDPSSRDFPRDLPAMTLKLPDGVVLDLVLIPEGKAVIGVPGPVSSTSGYLLGCIGGLGLCSLIVSLWLRRRRTKRFQFGLLWLLSASLCLGVLGWGITICIQHNIRQTRYGFARPQEEIAITKPYYMGRFEVTQAQYKAVAGQTLDKAPWNRSDDRPENECSFFDAQRFCDLLSKRVNRRIRLPTEMEWEYACRAGMNGPFTPDRILARAWIEENTRTLMPVGQKEPNEWGLFDMLGNAEEWCTDRFERENGLPCRVVKGGAYCTPIRSLEILKRKFFPESGYAAGFGEIRAGFRVVCEIEDYSSPTSAPLP